MSISMHNIIAYMPVSISFSVLALNNPPKTLFACKELSRSDLAVFPQWLSAIDRHLEEMTFEEQADQAFDRHVFAALFHVTENRLDRKNWQAVWMS